ncbi:MAG: hypothetical protein GX338_11920 [Firmicutes bacterium]|jgi:hypothetical protein|nr:hypothetical protein [Bacillota bacterium]
MNFWEAVVRFHGVIGALSGTILGAALSHWFLRTGRIVFKVTGVDVSPWNRTAYGDLIRSTMEIADLVTAHADITIYNPRMVGVALTSPEIVFRCGSKELARKTPKRYDLSRTRSQDLVWNIDARQALTVSLISSIEADNTVKNCLGLEVYLEVMIDAKEKREQFIGKLSV